MSVGNLDRMFDPRSVALIGATSRRSSVGAVVARNLGRAGFAGEMTLVDPDSHAIDGMTVYASIAGLSRAPDLAVIATPPETVAPLISELSQRGTRASVVISAGFGGTGELGRALRQAMMEAAKTNLLRIVGPSCVGTWCRAWGSTPRFLIS
jgi:acetyltransferase